MRAPTDFSTLPDHVRSTANAFVALFADWPLGRRAVSIGGSIGKGNYDGKSDIDMRLWHERDLPGSTQAPELWGRLNALLKQCADRGVIVDGVWIRKIDKIDATLRAWIAGQAAPDEMEWTVWGYHLPVDVFNQCVVDDPDGVLAEWRELLTPYPPALREMILAWSVPFLKYWRADYHYQSKVARGDAVFLASLTAKLVHHAIQVLFAINGEYYVGDGANLTFAERFEKKPADLTARVTRILYPGTADAVGTFTRQSDALASLIDDVLALAKSD